MRKALITGSASGLAVAFARKLAAQGFTIILNYRTSKARCEALASQLHDEFAISVLTVQADMTNALDIDNMMNEIEQQCGAVDTVVHSAGPFVFQRKRLTEYSVLEWDHMIAGNLSSAFHLFKRTIPLMRPLGFGRIITVGFDRVEQAPGWVYRSAYAAAKVGLASLTRTIALEEQENGITANMICPGDIRGKDKEADFCEDDFIRPLRTPIGADLAHMISFLVDEKSQFITGNVIRVAGETDVITHFDQGKRDVIDQTFLQPGSSVIVLPWRKRGVIVNRHDRHNRRSIYTVQVNDKIERFTVDQLLEVETDGL